MVLGKVGKRGNIVQPQLVLDNQLLSAAASLSSSSSSISYSPRSIVRSLSRAGKKKASPTIKF